MLHRVRLTVISSDPKTIHNSRKRARNGGKKVPFGAAIRAHGGRGLDQFLRRCLESLSRAYRRATICQEPASIGSVVMNEAGPTRRAED
jgi:hypothetical protein